MINICCYIGDSYGCGFYRIVQPYGYLADLKRCNIRVRNVMSDIDMEWSDIIVLQRQNNENVYNKVSPYKGRKLLVYEIDDYFHDIPSSNFCSQNYKDKDKIRMIEKFMELCDVVTVSTDSLKEKYSEFNKNIYVCSNCADMRYVNKDIKTKDDSVVRIGWAGSPTHHGDLRLVSDVVGKTLKDFENKIKFVIIGFDYRGYFKKYLKDYQMEYIGWSSIIESDQNEEYRYKNPVFDYYNNLYNANLDIGIAPLVDNIFNRCKSNIKAIEYGSIGIPCIASNVKPYRDFIDNNLWYKREDSCGLLCSDNTEWKKSLIELINNNDLRKSMSIKSKEKVVNKYSLEVRIIDWLKMIEENFKVSKLRKLENNEEMIKVVIGVNK